MSLLGIDVGTSSLKVAAFREDTGACLALAAAGYASTFPQAGRMELEPELVWRAFVEVTNAVAADPAVRRDPVTAVALSVSCDEIIPFGADGQPLGPCVMAPDTRGADALETLRLHLSDDEVYRRTGLPLAVMHPLARIIWYRRHAPGIATAAARWLGWAEFLLDRLGLPAVTDATTAGRWLAYDVVAREWWPEAIALAALDERSLPAVETPSTAIGPLGREAAATLGLAPGTLVVAGAFDQVCAAIGAGLADPGEVVVGSGSWENATVVLERPLGRDAKERGITWGPYVADRYAALIMNAGGVSVVRWFVDQFARDAADAARAVGEDPYAAVLRQASPEPAHALVLPHLQGSLAPWRDVASEGAILGITLATTREDLLRAVLEGITFELRLNLEPVGGAPEIRDPVRNTGGGARSPEWVQLKADILGRSIATVATQEPGCLGAALLAGVGCGAYPDVATAQAQACRIERVVDPNLRLSDHYDRRYATYRMMYPALRPLTALP